MLALAPTEEQILTTLIEKTERFSKSVFLNMRILYNILVKSKTGHKYKSSGIEGNYFLRLFFAQLLYYLACLEPLGE